MLRAWQTLPAAVVGLQDPASHGPGRVAVSPYLRAAWLRATCSVPGIATTECRYMMASLASQSVNCCSSRRVQPETLGSCGGAMFRWLADLSLQKLSRRPTTSSMSRPSGNRLNSPVCQHLVTSSMQPELNSLPAAASRVGFCRIFAHALYRRTCALQGERQEQQADLAQLHAGEGRSSRSLTDCYLATCEQK